MVAGSPRRVVVVAVAPAQVLDVAGPMEVFSQAGRLVRATRPGLPSSSNLPPPPAYALETVLIAGDDGPAATPAATTCGLALAGSRPLAEALADARPLDTLLVAGGEGARGPCGIADPGLHDALRQLAGRARRVASVCTGAFPLAAAGLLDGRRAVTHWRWCARLAREFPRVRVDPEPIFIRDGRLWTSAGISAGMDLALALVEEDLGHRVALAVARELVLFLRRPGGQSQFSAALASQGGGGERDPAAALRELPAWIAGRLEQPLAVATLARQVGLSPRQFARVFAGSFGTTPARLVERLRVEAARRRLEEKPTEGLPSVAARCGFGSEETLRRAFRRALRVPPGRYRERFTTAVPRPPEEVGAFAGGGPRAQLRVNR